MRYAKDTDVLNNLKYAINNYNKYKLTIGDLEYIYTMLIDLKKLEGIKRVKA